MGSFSGLSLTVTLTPSLLVVPALFSQGGGQRGGSWAVVGHLASPFHLSPVLLVGGGLLVLCPLPGPPVIKQLTRKVTLVPGQGGQF